MLGLRRQPAEENERVGVIETKTLSLRKPIAELQSVEERLQESTATLNFLERALLNTTLTTSGLNRGQESRKNEIEKADREASASRIPLRSAPEGINSG